MNPGEKGWLKEYLEARKELLTNTGTSKQGSLPEQSLYRLVQPTGIMYGQPAGSYALSNTEKWDDKDRMKILLAESLISSALLFHDKSIKTPDDLSKVLVKALDSISNFYNNIFPELATPTKTLFGRKKTPLELAERILDKRIDHTAGFDTNFWVQFFHNSLLFLDVFIFGQWIHTNADRIVSDFFKYEREELRFSVVKVIACAAHANATIADEERRLLDFFMQSTDLANDKRREAKKIFDDGLPLEEISLPTNNSWILKKYFLEIAILTIWADRQMDDSEVVFLKQLTRYIGFSEEDLENSQLAVEGFVLEHWEHLSYLQNKQNYDQLSKRFVERMTRVTQANKSRLLSEVQASGELMTILKNARSRELSNSEKEKLQGLLIQALKTIPTFVITALPQHYLTLPILLKILPSNFFAEVAN